MKNVLILGAHPDDCELNAGGFIHRFSKSKKIFICNATGSRTRRAEGKKAASVLGIQDVLFVTHHKDTEIYKTLDTLIKQIDFMIKTLNIDTIITHSLADAHQDHAAVARAACASSRLISKLIFFKPTAPSTGSLGHFNPNFVVKLSKENIKAKCAALREHKSQLCKYGEESWIKVTEQTAIADAWVYGGFHGFCELFEVSKMVE